jgi:hypothetical protein
VSKINNNTVLHIRGAWLLKGVPTSAHTSSEAMMGVDADTLVVSRRGANQGHGKKTWRMPSSLQGSHREETNVALEESAHPGVSTRGNPEEDMDLFLDESSGFKLTKSSTV